MLQEFREKIQGGLAKVIIILICIPFAFFGIESFLRGPTDKPIAEVDNVSITESDLREMIFLKKRQLMVEMGDNIDYAKLEDAKLRAPALEDLINNQLLVNEAHQNKLLISDLQAQREIISTPAFMQDNQFSNEQFKFVIQQAGLTEELYLRLVKKELLINQLVASLTSSEFLTKQELGMYESMMNEVRDISLIKVKLDKIRDQITISDAELQQYYDTNNALFKSDEKVALEYLKLSIDDYKSAVSDQDLKQAYQNEMSTFKPENVYGLSHIQLNESEFSSDEGLKEQLAVVLSELKKGQFTFADLAKKYSNDLGSKNLGGKLGQGKASLFPEAFINAVDQLKEGQYTQPIKIDSAYHIIKLDTFKEDTPPSFADRKDALANEIMLAKAEPLFNGDQERLKDLAFNFSNLDEAAKQLKKKTISTAALTKQEVMKLFADPQLVAAIFADEVLLDGQNTDVFEVTDNVYVSARVKSYEAAAIKPFKMVKNEVRSIVFKQKAEVLLSKKIDSIKEALQKEVLSPEAIAKQAEAEFKSEKAVGRNSYNKFDRITLGKAFDMPPIKSKDEASIETVNYNNGDKAIIIVNNTHENTDNETPSGFLTNIEQMLIRSKGSLLVNTLQTNLKSQATIEIQ